MAELSDARNAYVLRVLQSVAAMAAVRRGAGPSFTDYEPGIHWPQSQMQAGETGINAIRIYSPVKQGYDQDPDGSFTATWVPELAHLEGKALQEPWTLPDPPKEYPVRIVDHMATARSAKERIYALRRTDDARAEARAVFDLHGSRKPRHLRTPRKRTDA